jgi:hypothetical protein
MDDDPKDPSETPDDPAVVVTPVYTTIDIDVEVIGPDCVEIQFFAGRYGLHVEYPDGDEDFLPTGSDTPPEALVINMDLDEAEELVAMLQAAIKASKQGKTFGCIQCAAGKPHPPHA